MNKTDSSFREIVKTLSSDLGVEVCSLYLFHHKSQQLELVASSGLDESAFGSKLSIKQGLTGKVARTQRPVAVRNPHTDPDYFYIEGSGEEQYNSYLGIPLIHQETLLGVLVLQTRRTKMFFLSEITTAYSAGRKVIDMLNANDIGQQYQEETQTSEA